MASFIFENNMISIFVLAFFILQLNEQISAADDDGPICSLPDPDSSKTCISIKFPWKEDPVYFCTAKENVNYVPQCDDQYSSASINSCFDDGRNDTLKIATPWDCCPLISTPNHCVNVKCPPKPFNRTCKDIRTVGQCCPTYFCDDDEPSSCKLKRMKSSCTRPPADKANCTIYRDPFGCCVKYQCPEDEKPGNCSTPYYYAQASVAGTSTSSFASTSGKVVVTTNGKPVVSFVKLSQRTNVNGNFGNDFLQCTGDNTCPDDMKCCPISASIYPHPQKNQGWNAGASYYPQQPPKNQIKLIDGVCRKPVSASESNSNNAPTPAEYNPSNPMPGHADVNSTISFR